MPTNYFPGNLQWLGIAKETTSGTPAAAPTAFVPLVSPKLVPKIATLPDSALRGSMAKTFSLQQGMQYFEFSYSTYPYLDSVYQHLMSVLGTSDQVSGVASGVSTTLSAATIAGATSVTVGASVPANSTIQIDSGAAAEVRTVTAVTGTAAPFTLTLGGAPLAYPHSSGAAVTQVNADPITHKTALNNTAQPPSYTLWHYDAAGKCWQIPGAKNNNLKISAKVNALAQLDAGWTGLSATPIAPPVNAPTGNAPMPTWNSVVTVGGTALQKYSEVGLTYKRATEPIFTLTGGQAPFAIYAGELEVSGDLNGIYQGSTDNDLQNFLTNGQPGLTLKLAPAGDATHALTLQHTRVAYTDSGFEGMNKWLEVKSKVTALANATDALDGVLSPAQAIFTTPVTASY